MREFLKQNLMKWNNFMFEVREARLALALGVIAISLMFASAAMRDAERRQSATIDYSQMERAHPLN
jgi:hypothetical protein